MTLTGKNVVFVGGFGGIGYEACKLLVQQNIANLFVLDLIEDPSKLDALSALNPKCNVRYIKFDITDKASIQQAFVAVGAKIGNIDILVNGAGILSDRHVERTININLIGLINTTFEALPYMDKRKRGRGGLIANIASVLGLEPCGAAMIYTASKFGVIGFTRSLADPYYYDLTGVAVTALCPGLTDTPLKNSIPQNCTFDYSFPLAEAINSKKMQSSAICGEHCVSVLEANKNGSLWISDIGTLREVEPKLFWEPVDA